jgi:hypothetical protein
MKPTGSNFPWLKTLASLSSIAILLSGTPSALAFDGSDAEVPRIDQMTLMNPMPLKGSEPIAVRIKVSDDKNWVRLDGTLNIGFSYRLLPGKNVPPNCATVTTAFSKLEAIEIASLRTGQETGRKNQTFWLVGFLPAKGTLVSNCAEYRDFKVSPAVLLNATSFKSVTPRGSTIPVISGGIFTPRIIDESGRIAQSAQTALLQEFNFVPVDYEFTTSSFCFTASDGSTFRDKNAAAISQYAAELKIAQELSNPEIVILNKPLEDQLSTIDGWTQFIANPSIELLKGLSKCPLVGSSSLLIKTMSDVKTKLKTSNAVILKANTKVRCEIFASRYAAFEILLSSAKVKYAKTASKDAFRDIKYSLAKVDCNSSSLTNLILDSREKILQEAESALVIAERVAFMDTACKPLQSEITKFKAIYMKAISKYSGSRYFNSLPKFDFGNLESLCNESTMDYETIEIAASQFGADIEYFELMLAEADSLYKRGKVKFNFSCQKGSVVKVVKNTSGKCPTGFKPVKAAF